MNQFVLQAAALGFFSAFAANHAVGYSPEQKKVIVEIRDHGGVINVDEKRPGKPVVEVRFDGRMTADEVIEHLTGR
jgi:hypothetical protein